MAGQAITCPIDEHGIVRLPDGAEIHVDSIELGSLFHSTVARVGAVLGDNLGGAAGATGNVAQTQAQAQADALDLQWQALAQVIPPTTSLPTAYEPNLTATTFSADYSDWTVFHNDIASGSTSWATVTGDLTGWQAQANGWGSWYRATYPNAQLPPNFPSGSAGIASLVPSGLPSFQTVEWVVIAVAVGVGLWLLWPALVGARGLLAAL